MLKNYFFIAFRNFWRHKMFSLINILGLAIGISASLVIYLIVQYEFSFDKFHKDGDRIYRIVSKETVPDLSDGYYYRSAAPSAMTADIRNETTGLDEVGSFATWDNATKVSVPAVSGGLPAVFKKQKNIIYADEHYFTLFDYNWIAGSPKTSLQQPYQVVLSESNALLYFPELSAGEIIGRGMNF